MSLRLILPMLALVLVVCSCGSDKSSSTTSDLAAYFPQQFPEMPFKRAQELAVFRGEELGDYLADTKNFYEYNFSDMVTSNYRDVEVEVAIDLYRFAKPADAWGYFMTTLPEKPYRVPLGIDAHTNNFNLHFVKGRFVAKLVVFQDERRFRMAMRYLAIALEKVLPGDTTLPREFDLFPIESRLEEEIAYRGRNYLETDFLNEVFSVGYKINNEVITMFMTDDPSGSKFANFQALSAEWPKMTLPVGLKFDNEQVVIADSGEYGWILFGLKGGWLVGVVNYERRFAVTVANWLGVIEANS